MAKKTIEWLSADEIQKLIIVLSDVLVDGCYPGSEKEIINLVEKIHRASHIRLTYSDPDKL